MQSDHLTKTFHLAPPFATSKNAVQVVAYSFIAFAAFFYFAFQEKSFILLSLFAGVLILATDRDVVRSIEVDEFAIRIIKRSSSFVMRWDRISSVRVDAPPDGPGFVEIRGPEGSCEFVCNFFTDGLELYSLIIFRLSHINIDSIRVANTSFIIPYFWRPLVKSRKISDT